MKDSKKQLSKLKEKNKNFIEEFKEFIARGNVMDLAVGVIVGNAFSKIVTSLTDNVLMPIVGVVVGGFDFTNLAISINVWGRTVDLKYGMFIQNTVDFLITAFCIFLIVKIINKLFHKNKDKDQKVEEKPKEVKKSDETILLEEIRDLLKNQAQNKYK